MRILLVNKLYHPWIGGIETTTRDIAEGLHTHGFEIEVLACVPKGAAREEIINGVTIHKAASLGIFMSMPISIDFFTKFKRLIKNSNVVFIQHPFPLGTLAYLLFGNNKPMVIWYHSDIERQKIANLFFAPLLLVSLRKARKIFVASKNIANNSKYLKSVLDKVSVLPFSVKPEDFIPTPDIIKTSKSIRENVGYPFVLSVGRLVPYKGFEYLIRAMRFVDANLLIIGRGPLLDNLRFLANQEGISRKIHFLDYVSNLIPYYYACDVFVLPSIYKTEAFGLVQLEAMACSKPVINTSIPTGVPEVSLDGKTGYTVPPRNATALADAISKLISNPRTLEKFGGAAHERLIRNFSREKFLNSLGNSLREIQ